MATKKKMLQAAAGSATGGAALDITDVFSTYLYTGNGSTQTITNDIDLDGEGGLVWTKVRTQADSHYLWDTERGVNKRLSTNQPFGENNETDALNSFNSNGFTLGSALNVNGSAADWGSAADYASWTFRKAPKFFDVVTYTGDGVSGRTVSHDLGSAPGMMLIKLTSGADGWAVYHRGLDSSAPEDYRLVLNGTNARIDNTDGSRWNRTAPTSSVFSLGADGSVNANGSTYVAYLFAHNDGDGGFGPNADQDIIKCGSLTTNSDGSLDLVDLGFEPQWLLIKNSSTTGNWEMYDVMRDGTLSTRLRANLADAEVSSSQFLKAEATGFSAIAGWGGVSKAKIYMAIRRGPLAQPESGTEVFAIDTRSDATSNPPSYSANGIVDMALQKELNASGWGLWDRLRGQYRLQTHLTNAEDGPFSYANFDHMDGWGDIGATDTTHSWMWKRAPGFFDVVAYSGNGVRGRTVSHNLGVVPEMMWIKNRDDAQQWLVYIDSLGGTQKLYLSSTSAVITASIDDFNNTNAEATQFTLGNDGRCNANNQDYIAYLFATLPGVSKVGSYTGNGSTLNIDCGFTSGARFVLIKTVSTSGSWYVLDTARGIVAGNDPVLSLNTTGPEEAFDDLIDPYSAGFTLNGVGMVNANNVEYIFYAIA